MLHAMSMYKVEAEYRYAVLCHTENTRAEPLDDPLVFELLVSTPGVDVTGPAPLLPEYTPLIDADAM